MPRADREELAAAPPRRPDASSEQLAPWEDAREYIRNFARKQPETFALWCLGIGFVLGWRLKPW